MSNVATLRPPARGQSVCLRLSLLALSCFVITYYAVHHGSYSLIDRQQMAVFVWVAIGVAAILGLLPAVNPPRVLLVPLLAVLLMATWTLMSLAWTESAERTFAEFARIIGYLGVLVLIWLGVGRLTWRLVSAGLLAAGVLVCFLIMLSRLWPGIFPPDFVLLRLGTSRINYPFGYWNAVGCWCAMTSTLCLAYAAHARSGIVRGLALGAVPICAVGLYLALSRAGFGGAIIGAAVVIVLAHWRWLAALQTLLAAGGSYLAILAVHQRSELINATGTEGAWAVAGVVAVVGCVLALIGWAGARFRLGQRLKMPVIAGRRLGITGGIVAAVVVVVLAIEFGGRAYDEFTGKQLVVVSAPSQRLTQLGGNRHSVWESAWRAFEHRPVAGIGPGTFEFWWSREAVNGEFLRDVHNIYLEALAETGIVGFLALIVFLGGLLWSGIAARSRVPARDQGIHAGLIAVFVGFLFQAGVDWMWESTAITVFALVAIAVAAAAAAELRTDGVGATGPIALMLVSALAVLIMFAGLATRRQIDKSQEAFNAGNPPAALKYADNAIAAQRWSARAWSQRALALEAMGDYDGALVAIRQAENLEPYNWRWPLVAARAYVGRGDTENAAAEIAKAKSLRPLLPFFASTDRSEM